MKDRFDSKEIIKLLSHLVGDVEAVGETNTDIHRLENLKMLIDITNWCLDGVYFAMQSGSRRYEASMREIGWTAQCALDEWRTWIEETLNNV